MSAFYNSLLSASITKKLQAILNSQPNVKVGQIALMLDAEGLDDNFLWILAKVTELGLTDFAYKTYIFSGSQVVMQGTARRPYSDVIAAYDEHEAEEMEKLFRRFDESQAKVLSVYHDARQAFINAIRQQDQTAMENLTQDSEKLYDEIKEVLLKFGVNVAMFGP
jgi:hypothetical protein